MPPASSLDLFGDAAEPAIHRKSIQTSSPTFHQDKTSKYALPNDSFEHVRLDAQAAIILNLMKGKIIHAPIQDRKGQRVLDIGCGTGIITDVMARLLPESECIGVDLSEVPNTRTHQDNVHFFKGNVTTQAPCQWTPLADQPHLPQDKELFDYLFSRLLIVGMTNWPDFVRKEYELVKPGGWVEIQDLSWTWYHSDNTAITKGLDWQREVSKICEAQNGMDFNCGRHAKQWMEQAGFVDVQVTEYVWSYHEQKNPTPERKELEKYLSIDIPAALGKMIDRVLNDGTGSEQNRRYVEEMQESCRRHFALDEDKHQVFSVTIGRKPE